MSRSRAWLVAGCVLSLAGWACGDSTDDGTAGTAAPPAGLAGTSAVTVSAGAGGGAAGVGSSGSGVADSAGTGAGGTAGTAGATAGAGGSLPEPSSVAGTGGTASGEGGRPADTTPPALSGFDYNGEAVVLSETLTIAAGETVRVGPGTKFTAAGAAVNVQVNGTLIVAGTAQAPVEFMGAGVPRSWGGIVIARGGKLELTHAKIGGATYGIHALAGSSYKVDRAEIGTSFKVAVLLADGSFDHTKFHASGDDTFSPVNEVSADDVNGTLTIIDASPTISNSSFDNSSPLVDMVRIGGNASPVFDHVSITSAHCGFHTNGGVNTKPTIKNSVLSGMAYGIMAYTGAATFENCNFIDNSTDVGFCFGTTVDNAPTLANNFYSSGAAIFDPTCFEVSTPDATPASAAHEGAGPVGL